MRLFGDLSGAGLSEIFSWTECPQHLDMAVSTASHALFDLLSELLGKAADNERVGRLLKSLSDIESITPESHGFETLTKLLLLLTKVAVSSPIKYHSCEPLLKSLLYQLKTGWSCKIRKSEKENDFLICLLGLATSLPTWNYDCYLSFSNCSTHQSSLPSNGNRLKCNCYSILKPSKIQLLQSSN